MRFNVGAAEIFTVKANTGATRGILTNTGSTTIHFHQGFPVSTAVDGGTFTTPTGPVGQADSAILLVGESIMLSMARPTYVHGGAGAVSVDFDWTPLA